MAGELWTIGHGTHPADEFAGLLAGAGASALVDVRTAPGSRRNPQFTRTELARWLPAAGVDYRWEPRLGGFRRTAADSPDVIWRNDSFRGYAGYMRTPEFGAALGELLAGAAGRRTVIMCSESVWWRCHRRLIADAAILLHGWTVRHVMPDGRTAEHRPTDGVRVTGDGLVYDGGVSPPRGDSPA